MFGALPTSRMSFKINKEGEGRRGRRGGRGEVPYYILKGEGRREGGGKGYVPPMRIARPCKSGNAKRFLDPLKKLVPFSFYCFYIYLPLFLFLSPYFSIFLFHTPAYSLQD